MKNIHMDTSVLLNFGVLSIRNDLESEMPLLSKWHTCFTRNFCPNEFYNQQINTKKHETVVSVANLFIEIETTS